MPRMLCDIVADVLSAEPDMEVVGVLSSRGKLRATVAETRADVVVLALGDSRLPKDCERLLRAHPRLRVLGVTSEGRRGFLFGLRPLKASLGELSPQRLVNAIRTTDRMGRTALYTSEGGMTDVDPSQLPVGAPVVAFHAHVTLDRSGDEPGGPGGHRLH